MRYSITVTTTLLLFLGLLTFSCEQGGESVTGPDTEEEQQEQEDDEQSETTTGVLEVIVSTAGPEKDQDGYTLLVNENEIFVDTADTAAIDELEEGSFSPELTGLASNCATAGDNPKSADVAAGDTTSVNFEVTCESTTSVITQYMSQSGSASARIVNAEALKVRPGKLNFLQESVPFLTQGPDSLMLIIPESASADGTIELNEMMGILSVPAEMRPVHLKEGYPGSQWSFSGEKFVPSTQWVNGENQYPGSQWMPEDLSNLAITFLNGDHSKSELFGDLDISEFKQSNDAPINSDQNLAIAAPADLLFGLEVNLNKNLAEVLNQSEDSLNYTTGIVNTGGILIPKSLALESEIGNSAVLSVPGNELFEGSSWTPEKVSVFEAPVSNIFASDFSPYPFETQLLLVGGDRFGSAPERFRIHPDPNVVGLKNYRVFIASSILDIELGLYPSAGAGTQLNYLRPIASQDGTYFPASFYHPVDFTFPERIHSSDSRFVYLPLQPSYDAEAMTEYGIVVDIEQ